MNDKNPFSKAMELAKLVEANVYTCPNCGKKIAGEIPFKIHAEKCTITKKSTPKKTTKAEPKAPEELKRILKGRLDK